MKSEIETIAIAKKIKSFFILLTHPYYRPADRRDMSGVSTNTLAIEQKNQYFFCQCVTEPAVVLLPCQIKVYVPCIWNYKNRFSKHVFFFHCFKVSVTVVVSLGFVSV